MVKRARIRTTNQRVNSDFVVSSADKLPFISGIFDSVLCVTVLQHIVEEALFRSATAEIARILKNGGNIILLEYSIRTKSYMFSNFQQLLINMKNPL